MVNSFLNNFWDTDWDGTEGYDTLLTRLKDGKKLYDAFSEFVRNRAKLEDDYGKSLIKLAQIATGNEETGSLRTSWDSIKKETENIGLIHCDLSKQLTELVERSLRFREKQKVERLKVDETMRREQKEKKASHENMVKTRRLYEQRCKEYDAAKEQYKTKSSYTPKEEEKLKKNKQKCKSVVEASDSNYQHSVQQLEHLRTKYISSMEDTCKTFQTIEEERIQFLRNEMWLYANHGSTQVANIDEKYEDCRKILEKCNEKQDVQLFINLSHTGSIRPPPIEYVNYYHKGKSRSDTNRSTENKSTNINPNINPNINTNVSLNINPNINPISIEKSASNPNLTINRPAHTSTNPNHLITGFTGQHAHSSNPNLVGQRDSCDSNQLVQIDNYPSVSEINVSSSSGTMLAQAAFVYQSQSEQELSLNPGDLIEVKNIVDDTWAIGVLDGKVGAFPLTFVDIIQQH